MTAMMQMPVQPQQLSLIDDLMSSAIPITQSPQDIGFHRNNLFIDIRDLGLGARRALDALYFLVSQQDVPCGGFDYALSYVKWLMNYDSNNRAHLKKIFREAQKGAIEINDIDPENPDKDRWVSVPLLGPVGIAAGRVVFEVDQRLQRQLIDPTSSTYLSLRITNALPTLNSRILYDQLGAVAYRGGTEWLDLEVVRDWFRANDAKALSEFKYFKRDVLDPSIELINEKSDIRVGKVVNTPKGPKLVGFETRPAPGTKKIAKIRFVVVKKQASEIKLPEFLPLGSQELYHVLRDEFGLADEAFDEIMANRDTWNDDRIQQAIDFTRHRLEQGKVTKSPAGFLMKALRENYRVSSAELAMAKQAKGKAVDSRARADAKDANDGAHREKVSAEIVAGVKIFDALEPAERERVIREFARTNAARAAATRAKVAVADLCEEVIRASDPLSRALGGFLAQKKGVPQQRAA